MHVICVAVCGIVARLRQPARPWPAALFVLGLLAAAVPNQAGTQENPDIADPQGDVQVWNGYVNVARPEIDILAAWATRTPEGAVFGWRVVDVSSVTLPAQRSLVTTTFKSETLAFAAVTASHQSNGIWMGEFFGVTWAGDFFGANAWVEIVGSTIITASVRDVELGFPLVNVRASGFLASELFGPPIHNAWFRDWAPDEGYGGPIEG